MSEGQRKQLEHDGLIVSQEIQRAPDHKTEQLRWPWWTVRVQYYWNQHFPANGSIQVLHSYLPVVGGGYITSDDDGASSVGFYCGNQAALKQIKDLKARLPQKREPNIALYERNVRYILTTGNNWSGPIGHFSLAIDADSPDDIVLTCLPGVKKVSPTRYEVNHSDFRPDRELDLMILQANR